MPKNSNLPAVLKSKTPKVYKNKKLNNANFSVFNLNDYQVFLFLISKLGKVDAEGKYLQPEKLQREHTITALEFANAFNISLPHAYPILKNAAAKLIKSTVIIEKPELFQTWEIAVLSMAEYHYKEGKVTIEFSDRILPYLAQTKQKFVLYNLKEVANFGSLHTIRFYELIQEWQTTGYIRKSVDELRNLFAVGHKYKLYAHFKDSTFQHAINEINAKTEYNISFEEIKTGRKVTAIEFRFTRTAVEKRFRGDGTQKNTYIKPLHKETAQDA